MLDDTGLDCGVTLNKCLVFDRGAEARLNQGVGTELTLKETFDRIDEMGKYPIIHVGGGRTMDPKEIDGFCSCHWDCCLAMTYYYLPGSKTKQTDWIGQNRFRATVDPEKCIGCRVCVDERCQFGAAQMKYYPEFGEERAYVDEKMCVGCGLCVETCPVGCKGMKIVEPPEYITKVAERRAEVLVGGRSGVAVEVITEEAARLKAASEEK